MIIPCAACFNAMALIINFLLENKDEKCLEHYMSISEDRNKSINSCLAEEFPELDSTDLKVDTLCGEKGNLLSEKIVEFMKGCNEKKDYFSLIKLLSQLDLKLSEHLAIIKACIIDNEISGINNNIEETGIQLLPRCECFWAHVNREKTASINLNNFLKYFYFIEVAKMAPYKVRHHFLNPTAFQRAQKKKYLTIGVAPFCSWAKLAPKKINSSGQNLFRMDAIENVPELADNAGKLFSKARDMEVDILCFPEMLGHNDIVDTLKNKLPEILDSETTCNPVLTVCPTVWENRSNRADVLLENGKILCSQYKHRAFLASIDGEEFLEDLSENDNIELIHCDGIGRIAVVICIDALTMPYLQMLWNTLKVTLLIVPAFSTGYYDFLETFESSRAYDCCVAWVNSCSVATVFDISQKKLETIGAVFKNGRKSSVRNGAYYFRQCQSYRNGEGMEQCENCLFTQRINFSRDVS